MAARELTYRQRMFVAAYLGQANGNATEAARIVGYAEPNVQGPRLLVNVRIRAAIDAKLHQVAMSSDEVLARLSDMAAADISEFIAVEAGGEVRVDLGKAKRRGKTHLVKKLVPTRFGLAIELHDPQAALEKLGRYHGLFGRDANQGGSLDVRETEDLLAKAEDETGGGGGGGDVGPDACGYDDESGADGPGPEPLPS